MFSRASSLNYASQNPISVSQSSKQESRDLRRSKSISSVPTVQSALFTGPEKFSTSDTQNQAKAAAAHAYGNDLRRRESLKVIHNQRSFARFEPSPPRDPEYNRDAYFEDVFTRKRDIGGCSTTEVDPFVEESAHLASLYIQEPSSYRRIHRSRSVFSIQHHKSKFPEAYSSAVPERSSNTGLPGPELRQHRSMSFLRGGTDFVPRSLRDPRPVTSRRTFYFPTASHELQSSSVTVPSLALPYNYNMVGGSRGSLRKKVRKISESILQTVKRAFGSEKAGAIPAQHVQSTRSYVGAKALTLLPENGNNTTIRSTDIFLSRVNSGVPSLQRVSIACSSPQAGSIRIVTPPHSSTPVGTPTSGNTWATNTTESTWASRNTTTRLSVIQESAPGMPKGKALGDKEENRQLVYSAYMRIARRNAEVEGAKRSSERPNEIFNVASITPRVSSLKRTQSVQGNANKPENTNKEKDTGGSSPTETISRNNGSPFAEGTPTKTHVTIGPRVILYPLPDSETTQSQRPRTSSGLYSIQKVNPDVKQEVERRSPTRTVRQVQSATTFFPSTAEITVRRTPSPYKRAKLRSPSLISVKTPTQESEKKEKTPDQKIQREVDRRKVSFDSTNNAMRISGPQNCGDFPVASRKDEDVTFTRHEGFSYPNANNNETQHCNPGEKFALELLKKRHPNKLENRDISMAENSLLSSMNAISRRNRVLRSKVPQELVDPRVEDNSIAQFVTASEGQHKKSWSKMLGLGRKTSHEMGRKISIEQAVEEQFGLAGTVGNENQKPIIPPKARQTSGILVPDCGAETLERSMLLMEHLDGKGQLAALDGENAQNHRIKRLANRFETRVISASSLESDGAVFL